VYATIRVFCTKSCFVQAWLIASLRASSQEEILANAMLLPSLHNAKVSIFLTYAEVQKQRNPDSTPAAILAELARLDKAAPDVCALYDAHL